ncbi:23785_t:CDS:2 [Gigaspora rosea]|nr:23785_t:CDS:2 [Gigaspora rosea]
MTITPDPKVKYGATFEILREDHTMGNLIRFKLLEEPQVIFAGYKVPHPLEHNVILKVQTTNDTKPDMMVAKALNDLIMEVGYLKQKFVEELGRARALVIPREQKLMEEQTPLGIPPRDNIPIGNTGVGVDMDF